MPDRKILVVEDEPTILQVLQRILSEEGYRVVTAANGEEAMERVFDPSGLPDLILADIAMPRMDGFELCRQVRGKDSARAIPFIFITAKTTALDRAKAYGLGAQRYLTKPFTRQQVLGAVLLALQDASRFARLEDKLPVSGKLAPSMVYFLIELFFLRRWSGRIVLSGDGQEGIIAFRQGEIASVSLGALSGEEALEKLVSWQGGWFTIEGGSS